MTAPDRTEAAEARNRHPGNIPWWLEKVRDQDIYRDLDLRYRVYIAGNGRGHPTQDCTDAVEALAQPSYRAGRWTPPLVRLLPTGLVRLTVAGEEKLAEARRRRASQNAQHRTRIVERAAERAAERAIRRAPAAVQFQAA